MAGRSTESLGIAVTPAAIHSNAVEFRRAFELCYGIGLPAVNGERKPLIPGVVCLVFSLELELKAILIADGIEVQTHDLCRLFNRLPASTQTEIVGLCGFQNDNFFGAALEAVSNAFVEWRYIHEVPGSRSLNVEFLDSLWRALHTVARRCVEAQRAELQQKRAASIPNGKGDA